MATVIGKVRRANARGRSIDKGELTVDGDTLEFRGEKETVRLGGVRSVSKQPQAAGTYGGTAGAVVKVVYGSPEATECFTILDIVGRPGRIKRDTEALVAQLRSAFGMGAAGGTEQPPELVKAQAARVMKATRIRMGIMGTLFVAGILVTVITYSRAKSGGGQYFVAWGAILFGGLYFIEALVKYRKAAGLFRQAGGTPAAPAPAEQLPDVAQLKAAGDVDGLVGALRHNELQVRIDAMAALAELRDPRAVDLLIAALTDPRWDVRWSAAEALGKLGDPRAVEPLRGVVNDDNAMVRAVAKQSITALEAPAAAAPSDSPAGEAHEQV